MLERITVNPEADTGESKRSYFDEHIYTELKSFICGTHALTEKWGDLSEVPSFEEVIDKLNGYVLRQDLRVRVLSETIGQLLAEIEGEPKVPSFLVSYLCREAIRKAVLHKFNTVLGSSSVDLLGLSYNIGDTIAEANRVFLSLRICDPSVGGGTILCAMLNEMIAVKSQLGILVDREGNPLYQYKFVVGETGLMVLDKKEFRKMVLDGSTPENRRIQEALYDEKMALVHHCLFGTDTNPLLVLVSKLRLWLELIVCLEGTNQEDLPFVESNILCGDALVSRFSLKDDLLVALKNINQTVIDYKRLVDNLKTVRKSLDRQYMTEVITLIRNRLIEGIGWYSHDTDELLRLRRELSEMMTPGLFPLSEQEERMRTERILLLKAKIKKQEHQLAAFRHHPAFMQAIEWRYVFPELLDDKGAFVGFDAFVGILPDAAIAGMGGDKANLYKRMNYKVYKRTGNISDLFCELANRLLAYGGCMLYLMPSNWRRDAENYKIGDYLMAEMDPAQLILFDAISSSYEMLKQKCALIAYKDINRHHTVMCQLDAAYNSQVMDLGTYMHQFAVPIYRLVEAGDTMVKQSISTVIASNAEYMSIRRKIKERGLLIKNWEVNIYSGVMTGCDEAFFVDKVTRDELIHVDYKNSDIIKPLLTGDFIKRYGDGIPEQWLLYIPWHFPLQYDKTIRAASTRAEQRFQAQYPDVYNRLLNYKKMLSARNTVEVGLGFEWYALQRSGMKNNWDDFSEQKIVWKRDSSDYQFGIDYGGCAVLDDTCFMVGQHLKFLLGVFNSTMGRFMLDDLSRLSADDSQAGIFVVESMSVPVPGGKMESDIISLVNRRISENLKSDDERTATEEKIDRLIYELYDLTESEIAYIKGSSFKK